MASTYSDLKVELIGTGEQTGTWGTTTNNNLSVALGEAITGSADVVFSGADVTVTLTDTNAAQTARNLRLNLTGTSGGARNLILGSGCQIEKLYLINNGLADAVTVKNTTGTGIAVPAGKTMFVFNNGTNVVEVLNAAVTLESTQINITGQGDLRLEDSSGGQYVALQAPSTVASSYTLTMPVDDGTNGQALITDGNGVLSWSTAASGDVYGPASSTTNAIPTFADTTGKLLQNNSGVTISSNTVTASGGFSTAANLAFTGTGNRITGDFSNATIASRVMFQNSTTDANTIVSFIPNGTATQTNLEMYNKNDPNGSNNPGLGQILINSSEFSIRSAIRGSGTYLPITMYTGGSERLRIETDGDVSIGTSTQVGGVRFTVVGGGIQLSGGTTAQEGVRIQRASGVASFTGINNDNNAYNALSFATSATEAMRIDTSGKVLVGTSTARANFFNGTSSPLFQIEGTSFDTSSYSAVRNSNDTSAAFLILAKSRGTTVGSNTIVNDGDQVGALSFQGNDGTEFVDVARITAGIDGTPGANDMPGRLMFFTTADGASTLTERMRIDSSGNVGIGVTPSAFGSGFKALQMNGGSLMAFAGTNMYYLNNTFFDGTNYKYVNNGFATNYVQSSGIHTWSTAASGTAGATATLSELMRIDSSGNVGIGTTSPSTQLQMNSSAATYSDQLRIRNTNFGNADIGVGSGIMAIATDMANITFYTSSNLGTTGSATPSNERMRIDSSGRLLVGTTAVTTSSTQSGEIYSTGSTGFMMTNSTAANYALAVKNEGTSGTRNLINFYEGSAGGTARANISLDGSANFAVASTNATTFSTASAERMRITSGGYVKASNSGAYVDASGSYHEFRQSANSVVFYTRADNASYADAVLFPTVVRAANSAYQFLYAISSSGTGSADIEFNLRGDGNGYADGTWNNNGADYAEFFESATGQSIPVGSTVVLENNKVRLATESDNPADIIGVVRPKEPSKASMVVGNTAWNKWANKYLTDDFDRYIMEDHDVVEWEETVVGEEGKTSTKNHSYESHNIPENITIPADATIKTHDDKGIKFQHYKLNPAWNPDAEYINRENRDEWLIIGLVGQVKVLKGQIMGERWRKMRNVSATVEEWFIR